MIYNFLTSIVSAMLIFNMIFFAIGALAGIIQGNWLMVGLSILIIYFSKIGRDYYKK